MTPDQKLEQASKSILESKTLYAGTILGLVVTFIPAAAPFVAANPEVSAWLVAGLMTALRFISKSSVSVKPSLSLDNLKK